MHDLLIAWPGGEARFSPPDSPIAVGRSAEAAVVLTDPAISRRHLEFVWLGSSWIANDSSTHGSFDPIGVRLASTWTVGADVTVRLGGVGGTEIRLALADPLSATETPAPAAPPAPAEEAGPSPEADPSPAAVPIDPPLPPPVEAAPPPDLGDLPAPQVNDPGPPSQALEGDGDPGGADSDPFVRAPAPPPPPAPAGPPGRPPAPMANPAFAPPGPDGPPESAPALARAQGAESVAIADHDPGAPEIEAMPAPEADMAAGEILLDAEEVEEPTPVLDPAPSLDQSAEADEPAPLGFGFEPPSVQAEDGADGAPSIFTTPPHPDAGPPEVEIPDPPAALENELPPMPSVFADLPAPAEEEIYHEHAHRAGWIEGEEPPLPPRADARPSILEQPGDSAGESPLPSAPPPPPILEQPGEPSPPHPAEPEADIELEGGAPEGGGSKEGQFDPDDTFTFRAKALIEPLHPDENADDGDDPLAELERLMSDNGAPAGTNGHPAPPAPERPEQSAPPSIFADDLLEGGPSQPGGEGDVDHGFPPTQAVPRISPLDEPPLPDAPEFESTPLAPRPQPAPAPAPQPAPAPADERHDALDQVPPPVSGDHRSPSPEPDSWDDFIAAQPDQEPAAQPTAADTIISNDTIQLSIDGQNYVFLPGVEVTVGRDPSCLVNLDERHSLVSRHHLKIEHRNDHWWIEDSSSKGTYVDGRKLGSAYKAEGAFLAHLGDDDAGTPMRIITAGDHKTPRSFNLLLVLVVTALVAVAIVALAFLLFGSRNGPTEISTEGAAPVADLGVEPPPGADLARAKQATVLLLSETGFGSGFFVADNLIVTNQHVAVLAPSLAVAVSRTSDEPAQVEFAAETVATHPYLDIAVLQLTVDVEGNPVSTSGLQPVPIGDSGGLTLGDEVYNTGFPQDLSPAGFDDMGDILLPAVSATSGEAANFSIWPGCSNPTRDEFIPIGSPPGVGCAPDGDITRAVVISTFSSGEGASGSPVFSGNEVVAVVFSGPEGNENAGRNIATAAFSDWLDEVIAENG